MLKQVGTDGSSKTISHAATVTAPADLQPLHEPPSHPAVIGSPNSAACQDAYSITTRKGFPDTFDEWENGISVWLIDDVEAWIKTNRPDEA
jgi:hypothetical protein